MPSVCLYFQVHQPMRVKKYRIFDIGNDHDYFNDSTQSDLNNKKTLRKVAEKCYLPTNKILFKLLKKYPQLKISYSFSGIFLEQLNNFLPDVLRSFRQLVKTGRVELMSETYYHSLAFFYSRDEFESQVKLHKDAIWDLFKFKPRVFRNTELAYNNDLAKWAEEKGYKAILAEGWDSFLGWRSPNFLYRPVETKKIKLL